MKKIIVLASIIQHEKCSQTRLIYRVYLTINIWYDTSFNTKITGTMIPTRGARAVHKFETLFDKGRGRSFFSSSDPKHHHQED